METKEYLEENIIDKIYNNDLYLSEILPDDEEYLMLNSEIKKLSNNILENLDKSNRNIFIKYMEKVNIKESIEARHQFKLGFKIAIKLIIEGMN